MPGQDYSATFAPLNNQPGMLQQATEAAGLQAQVMQNQAQAMQMKARAAMGPILQGSIDPKTGELDINKAFVGLSQHPDTAWTALDFLDKGIARQGTQAETALKHFDLAQKRQGMISQGMAAVLGSKEGPITGAALKGKAAELYGANPELFPKDQLIDFMTLVQGTPEGPPMEALAKRIALSSQTSLDTMKTVLPALQERTMLGQKVLTQEKQFAPAGQQVNVAATLPQGLTPSEASERAPFVDTTGEHTGVPGAVFQVPKGQLGPEGQPRAGGGASMAPGTPSSGAGVKQPPRYLPSEVPGSQKESLALYKEDLAGFSKLMQSGRDIDSNLDMMKDTLKSFSAGGGADWREKAARLADAVGLSDDLKNQIGNKSLQATQIFQSLAMDLASKMMARTLAGGGRFTNIEFQAFQDLKPNVSKDPKTISKLIKLYQNGVALDRDYMNSASAAMDKGLSYGKFVQNYNSKMEDLHAHREKYYKTHPEE